MKKIKSAILISMIFFAVSVAGISSKAEEAGGNQLAESERVQDEYTVIIDEKTIRKYSCGDKVEINYNTDADHDTDDSHWKFLKWTVEEEDVVLDQEEAEKTFFIMPEHDVNISTLYQVVLSLDHYSVGLVQQGEEWRYYVNPDTKADICNFVKNYLSNDCMICALKLIPESLGNQYTETLEYNNYKITYQYQMVEDGTGGIVFECPVGNYKNYRLMGKFGTPLEEGIITEENTEDILKEFFTDLTVIESAETVNTKSETGEKTAVSEEDVPQYPLGELGIGLEMPDSFSNVLTRDSEDADFEFYGMTKDEGIRFLEENNIYLFASSLDANYIIQVSAGESLAEYGVLGMTSTVEEQVRNNLESFLYENGAQNVSLGTYYSELGQLSYITAYYERVKDGVYPELRYKTVFNSREISIILVSLVEEISFEIESEFKTLIDSISIYCDENTPSGIQRKILEELTAALDTTGIGYSIDKNSGGIMMDSGILFDYDDYSLTEEGKQYLDKFCPAYASVILDDEFSGVISDVIFEGHTDTSGSYEYNLQLSQKRAEAVEVYCLGILDSVYREKMEQLVSAVGYSYDQPIYTDSGDIDMEASRRVEIKFVIDPDAIE